MMSGDGGVWLLRAIQVYAWGVFLLSWAQMGWVDWKEQKIRNHYLRLWLACVAGGYVLLAAQSALGALGLTHVFVLRDYYAALGGHLAFSVGAAYTLWWLRIWPAGDVKLFVLLALCYPLMRVPGSFRSGLLFLEVLINIFVPAAAFLFVTAGGYLWRTRFAAYKGLFAVKVKQSLRDAGLEDAAAARLRLKVHGEAARSRLERAGDAAASSLAAARAKAVELWRPVKADLAKTSVFYRENPRQFVVDAGSWFAMMAIMSMISYYLNDVITSNVFKTLICFALMFGWSRICQFIGTGWALALVFAGCAAAIWRHPNLNVPAFAVIFGHITVFSLCIWFGVQLATKVLAGEAGYALLPFLFMLPGLIPWRGLFSAAWSFLAAIGGAAFRVLPGMPRAPSVTLPRLPAGLLAAPSWASSLDVSTFELWAGMGLFFGLALVFVKIWDAESYKSVPVAQIERFMTLGPSLVERIEADPDFRDEHFSTFYADGLTGEQAEELKAWCRKAGIQTVPLAPTISFANWIFLGYLLTRLLDGHVLRFIY